MDKALIEQYIHKAYLKQINITIFNQVDSTNDYLLQHSEQEGIQICLAQQQTKGKGRLSRKWISPPNANIYLSMLWPFAAANGLSLVVAIAIVDALAIKDIGIKWPNDIYYKQRKLAGILIETANNKSIIGIGINVNMPKNIGQEIDQPWVDISEIIGTKADRAKITGTLINHLMQNLQLFQHQGLTPFLSRWHKLDILYNQNVNLITPTKTISGIARGINDQGYLLLEHDGKIETFAVGEVSVSF